MTRGAAHESVRRSRNHNRSSRHEHRTADAQTRPAVEYFGRPNLNGQPLPFSDAVRVGDVLYLSGQIGIGADGKLPDGIEAQTKQAMDNIGAVLKARA